MTDLAIYITAFATLFVVIDPIGLAPVFVSLTGGMSPRKRRQIARRACLIAAGILLVFGFGGQALLDFLGISMAAFRISGGMLLFLTALQMLFEERSRKRDAKATEAEDDDRDPSVFPLAIPLIAGPGAITSMILFRGAAQGWPATLGIFVVMLAVVLCVWGMFRMAGVIERLLGKTGIVVMTRILGMLLAALSIQFILDGLIDFGIVAV